MTASLADAHGSPRARALAAGFLAAAEALAAVIEGVAAERWDRVRKPGEWSPGKDAEHAADAAAMHLARMQTALGIAHAEPPRIERAQLTTPRSRAEIAGALRATANAGAKLIEGLSDAQLDLPADSARRPPRTVADVIARPLTRHLAAHQAEIEMKLRAR